MTGAVRGAALDAVLPALHRAVDDRGGLRGLETGGEALGGATQRYIYFLVAQDGTFIIRQRTGDNVQDVHRGTHAAVQRPGAGGMSTNALEVRVAGSQISYVVNGTVVHTTPKSGPTVQTDGIVGVRINHLLDVQVEGFQVQQQ